MLSSSLKYQTAMRLALRAWMIFTQDGSLACKKAYERMLKLAKSLRVPSGPDRSKLWIDIASQAEDSLKFGLVEVVALG